MLLHFSNVSVFVNELFLLWSSVWDNRYPSDGRNCCYFYHSFHPSFSMFSRWKSHMKPALSHFLSFLHTGFLFGPLCVLWAGHIMSTHLMCATNLTHTLPYWKPLTASLCFPKGSAEPSADCSPLIFSAGSPLASVHASSGTAASLLTGLCCRKKRAQSSRPPDGSPGGATVAATQPHLSLTNAHSQHSSQTRATYSSTLVMPWCFLYHVCQWAISLRAFWLQPLHDKKKSLLVSLVLDRQLKATLTTFTHTDPELNTS